jgi:hypothetical protein
LSRSWHNEDVENVNGPAERHTPGARPTEETEKTVDNVRIPPAGDGFYAAAQKQAHEDLYRAACEALRLLQNRQQHTPEEHLDSRERKVLRQLRAAVRSAS